MVNKVLNDARERLAKISEERSALDQEERELRAMVAAADGASAAPSPPAFPFEPLQPAPFWPPPLGPIWYVDPRPTITCGIQAQPQTIYVGDVRISPARSAASVIGLCGASICSTSSATEATGN